eukprot:c41809_g1_i1 orf=57-251(+)
MFWTEKFQSTNSGPCFFCISYLYFLLSPNTNILTLEQEKVMATTNTLLVYHFSVFLPLSKFLET